MLKLHGSRPLHPSNFGETHEIASKKFRGNQILHNSVKKIWGFLHNSAKKIWGFLHISPKKIWGFLQNALFLHRKYKFGV